MKFATFFAAAALAITAFATPAKALEVNYSGSSVNMGTVQIGQFGTITDIYEVLFSLPPNEAGTGEVYGFLPNNSKITFSYTLNGLVDGGVQSYGAYNHNVTGHHVTGSSLTDSDGYHESVGTYDGSPSSSLVFTTAYLNQGNPALGGTSIANQSGNGASFQSLFFGILNQLAPPSGVITYVVSAVPLPAALPMFGAMLAGLFGFARARRKSVAA